MKTIIPSFISISEKLIKEMSGNLHENSKAMQGPIT
jgi:hypothetical protein